MFPSRSVFIFRHCFFYIFFYVVACARIVRRGPACDRRRHGKRRGTGRYITQPVRAQLCKSIIDKLFSESFRDAPPHVSRELRKCATRRFSLSRMGDGFFSHTHTRRFVTIARPKTIGAGPLWRRRQRPPPYARRKAVFGRLSGENETKKIAILVFFLFVSCSDRLFKSVKRPRRRRFQRVDSKNWLFF